MKDLPKQKLSARLTLRRYAAVAAIATALAGGVIWAQSTNTASFQMYSLRYKAAADVEEILSELRVEFGSDTKIVADTRKNQILLSGPEAAQRIAQQLIDSIDLPPAKPIISKPVLRAYQCAERQLQIRAESLRKEFANQDNVRIAVDPHTSQLLILAPEDVHDQLIRQFGAQSGNTQPVQQTNTTHSERFVPLRNRTPQRVESLLRGLFDSRLEIVTDPQTGTANYVYLDRSGQQMRIHVDQRNNGVVLTGSESLQDQFARLISTLDGPKSESGERVRVVPIRRSDPVKLRQAIEAYRNGYRAPKTSNNSRYPNRKHLQPPTPLQPTQPRDGDQGQFSSDGPIQQASHFVQAEAGSTSDVVEDIPAADPQMQQGEPLPGDRLRELGPDVEIETLDDLDVIILRGRDRDVEEITRIIEEIERLSAETEPVIDIYMLKHVRGESVAELATAISEDFVGGRQGRVSITPLITPNALLLIGWGEAVKAMKDLIEKLDQPVEAKTQLRVFRLQHAPAASARTANSAWRSPMTRSPIWHPNSSRSLTAARFSSSRLEPWRDSRGRGEGRRERPPMGARPRRAWPQAPGGL